MGDRIRRIGRALLRLFYRAGLPALIIYFIVVASIEIRSRTNEILLPPAVYRNLLTACFIAAFIMSLLLGFGEVLHAARRADSLLIKETFGGFRKQDRLFCSGMASLKAKSPRNALERFLSVKEAAKESGLTDREEGVLSFYIARCYQELECPSNAVPYYRTALEKDFSKPFATLFLARCLADGGAFDESYQVFQELLASNPPAEFDFLYTDIGFLFIRQKKPEEAAEWFERSIAERQNYAFALSGMAIVSLLRGDFKTAREYHYKALVNKLSDPASFRAYYAETKALVLAEHPEYADQADGEKSAEKASDKKESGGNAD